MIGHLMMAFPIAFLLYVLITYVRWKQAAEPERSFARDYWYTDKNPLNRTWWPFLAVLFYIIAALVFGLLS